MRQERLKTNILKQNCYVRDVAPLVDAQSSYDGLVYLSMEENTVDGALVHETKVVDYEITPDYVNSFADGVDYRKDPVAAVVNAPHRTNVGDVRDFQSINHMDDTQAAVLYNQLKQRFAQVQQAQQAQPVQQVNQSEVKNDE